MAFETLNFTGLPSKGAGGGESSIKKYSLDKVGLTSTHKVKVWY